MNHLMFHLVPNGSKVRCFLGLAFRTPTPAVSGLRVRLCFKGYCVAGTNIGGWACLEGCPSPAHCLALWGGEGCVARLLPVNEVFLLQVLHG